MCKGARGLVLHVVTSSVNRLCATRACGRNCLQSCRTPRMSGQETSLPAHHDHPRLAPGVRRHAPAAVHVSLNARTAACHDLRNMRPAVFPAAIAAPSTPCSPSDSPAPISFSLPPSPSAAAAGRARTRRARVPRRRAAALAALARRRAAFASSPAAAAAAATRSDY